jgi:hypothetical protein
MEFTIWVTPSDLSEFEVGKKENKIINSSWCYSSSSVLAYHEALSSSPITAIPHPPPKTQKQQKI